MVILTNFRRQPADSGSYFPSAEEDVKLSLRAHIYWRLYLLPLILSSRDYEIVMKFTLKYPECGEKKEATISIAEDKKYLSIVCLNGQEKYPSYIFGG